LELRKAEWDYINEARRLENEERRLILQDKDSARKMHRQVQISDKANRLNKNVSAYLALITTALSFALFFVILFFPEQLQERGKDIIIYILGVLSAIVTQVFSFYFGSSMAKEEGSPGTP
jgi:K+-sensing histidine kinase KdpD